MKKPIELYIWDLLRKLGFKVPKHIILEYAKFIFKKKPYFSIHFNINTAIAYYTDGSISDSAEEYFQMLNPDFCEASIIAPRFWWIPDDVESRLKALDKLIKYYKQNPKAQ